MRVPVIEADTARSFELDRLLADWRAVPGAMAFQADWHSRPLPGTADELLACVEVTVTIASESAKLLRTTYEKLSKKVKANSIILSSRSCNLTDLFE